MLPTGFTFVSYTGDGTYVSSTGVWTVGSVANGSTASIAIVATTTSASAVSNSAQITASDQPDPDSTPNDNSTTDDDDASVSVISIEDPVITILETSTIVDTSTTTNMVLISDSNTITILSDSIGSLINTDSLSATILDNLLSNTFVTTGNNSSYLIQNNPISLTGELSDQFVTEGIYKYSVGDGEFRHSNPSETLEYTATLADGSPLPDYVQFNSETGDFEIDADSTRLIDIDSISIRVTAKDTVGSEATATFQVNFGKGTDSQVDSPLSENETLFDDRENTGVSVSNSQQSIIGNDVDNQSTSSVNPTGNTIDGDTIITPLKTNPISITADLTDQIVTRGIYKYSIPDNAFQHSDPSEVFEYRASLDDGSELPDFIKFDSITGTFTIDADQANATGIESLEINVIAYDSFGNEASASFQIIFSENKVEQDQEINSNDNSELEENSESEQEEEEQPTRSEDNLNVTNDIDEQAFNVSILVDTDLIEDEEVKSEMVHDENIIGKKSLSEQLQQAGILTYQQSKNSLYNQLLNLVTDNI
ncbi:MAG: hypothetical protein ACI9XC_000243 [Gammaproteobacteria bacterium]